jgi:hypothetical protein
VHQALLPAASAPGLIGGAAYFLSLAVAPATAAVWLGCLFMHIASIPSLFQWQRKAQKEDEEALVAVRAEIEALEAECEQLAEARVGARVAVHCPIVLGPLSRGACGANTHALPSMRCCD